jgi:hypothetical protein
MEDAKSISGVHDLVSLSDPAKSDVRNLSNWKIVNGNSFAGKHCSTSVPLPAFGDEDKRPAAETDDYSETEIAERQACSPPVFSQEQTTTCGKEAPHNRNREKRFALVRSQIERLTKDKMIA